MLLAICVFGFLPSGVNAEDPQATQTIEMLVTTAPGAPTPDQLVDYYSTRPPAGKGPPPLQGLTVRSSPLRRNATGVSQSVSDCLLIRPLNSIKQRI